MQERYQSYQQMTMESFLSKIISHQNPQDLLVEENFLSKTSELLFSSDLENHKVTKSGYILSPYVSAYETGIYVDLSPGQDIQIDQAKVDFMEDPGFKCYGEIANSFGFYVDKYCPWRLVLNNKHPYTQENILNKNYSRPFRDFYYSEYFYKVGLDDFWNLKSFYKKMYLNLARFNGRDLNLPFESLTELRWAEIFLLNRFREIGIMRQSDFYSSDESPTENKRKYMKILGTLRTRYGLGPTATSPLTHNSGIINYIENVCAHQLKNIIERKNIDTSSPRY